MNEEQNENSAGNMQNAYRISYLIAGYLKDTLIDAERDELDEWVIASDANMRLFAEMTDEKNIEKGLKQRGLYNADNAVEILKAKRTALWAAQRSKTVRLWVYGAAACLALLAGLLIFRSAGNKTAPSTATAEQNDLLPATNRAVLALSNGKEIVLDSMHGNILQQDGFLITNNQNTLHYQGQSGEVAFHTLTTPKGGQYQLVLPDGTKVWLNAASSLRFPTSFSGPERRVDVAGEAYFEVAHDAAKPFRVHAQESMIEVLGTHFNVAAHADEENVTTTLLEGSVKVSAGKRALTIKPGQQALIKPNNDPVLAINADVDEVMGWKEGLFEFKDEPIESIMREVARWYDAEVTYEGKIAYHFTASVERAVPVSKLLHFLELTNRVHFTIRNKTIIVKP